MIAWCVLSTLRRNNAFSKNFRLLLDAHPTLWHFIGWLYILNTLSDSVLFVTSYDVTHRVALPPAAVSIQSPGDLVSGSQHAHALEFCTHLALSISEPCSLMFKEIQSLCSPAFCVPRKRNQVVISARDHPEVCLPLWTTWGIWNPHPLIGHWNVCMWNLSRVLWWDLLFKDRHDPTTVYAVEYMYRPSGGMTRFLLP